MHAVVLFAALVVFTCEPFRSGPQPGQKYAPYSFLIATGPKRGTSHCYVCETGTKPAVIIFAQKTSEPLGELLKDLDGLVSKPGSNLSCWVTFLGEDQPVLEPKIAEWGKKLGLKSVPLGVFEDAEGPPSYRLNPQADVTMLIVNGGKVVSNHAFRADELKLDRLAPLIDAAATLAK